MSSSLFHQLAELAAETRHRTDRDGNQIVEKLTIVIGYGHMAEKHPQLRPLLEKHLQAFVDLACRNGYLDLCRHSAGILDAIQHEPELQDVALI